MPTPLLETKFYVPRSRPGLVPRPRLSERLDRGTASKLMLVSAPAGFGKTTLLTEWLAAGPAASADERLAAWLSLDRGDNDPASFWTYVIAALRTVASGVGESALALLHTPQPRPPIETVLTALLNDLGAVASDIVLVLDCGGETSCRMICGLNRWRPQRNSKKSYSEPSPCQAMKRYSGTAARDGVTAGKYAVLQVRLQFQSHPQPNRRFLKERRMRK